MGLYTVYLVEIFEKPKSVNIPGIIDKYVCFNENEAYEYGYKTSYILGGTYSITVCNLVKEVAYYDRRTR